MVFPFTFNVKMFPNPFSTTEYETPDLAEHEPDMPGGYMDLDASNPRKRARAGWLPASQGAMVNPSLSVSQASSRAAWFDIPSKYLKHSSAMHDDEEDTNDCDVQEPPMKRGRTIADSVISTALSAALIGAAVGIAAYRVWQGRGNPSTAQLPPPQPSLPPPPPAAKEEKQAPPPPYHPGEWAALPDANVASHPHHPLTTSARRARKSGRYAHTVGHSSFGHRRKVNHLSLAPSITPPPALRSPVARLQSPQSQASDAGSDLTEFDEHADWMGTQLSRLIAEGKRALNKDIVLPNDPNAPDTDGTQGPDEDWMDDEPERGRRASSSSSHYRRRSLSVPRAYPNTPPRSAPPVSASYSAGGFLRVPGGPFSSREEDSSLSPELREHMARARAARREY
ncbi:hypothetical protein BKA62DRAFT_688389 [Auriculariales sp. MPI-PUGE-AT-0066]|nr:hypothetical protein BKA62DRAFT_688389 [Auriculariales sp. MPI-PUGE-AT-0066]